MSNCQFIWQLADRQKKTGPMFKVMDCVFVYFHLYMCIWQLANQQKKTGPMFKNIDCVEIH